ncbi:MAG: GNAT family N-acetyltransferase [Deltaproteobacteria bacterium]|nr:GNAT family N-acetyltransferase [Deltaproteobacteria bacterium]TLN02874.1 MAG: GNAT family N-acetyltransferase [bacterium]
MGNKPAFGQGIIARTTVLSSKSSLRPVQAWVAEFARCFAMTNAEIARIELVVEEAFMSVVQSAFEGDETGEVAVVLEQRPGQFVIAVEDHGLPVDLKHLEENEGLALNFLLLKQLLDEFVFINKGKEGKRFELVKNLPAESVAPALHELELGAAVEEEPPKLQAPPRYRLLEPGEALALAQLAYRTYGYTYVSDFYHPDLISEKIRHGLMETCVAVTADGRIIGGLSLFYDHREAKVAECGAAMVDPRYRGLSLFKEMKRFLFEHARGKGLYGIYSEAVTIHPYTQQGNLTLGARETGILLSYVSDNVAFKKIGSERMGQRQTLVLFYYRLNPENPREVYVPSVYSGLVGRIYADNRLDRQLREVSETVYRTGLETQLEIQVRHDSFNDASIELQQIGEDAFEVIIHHTRELCEKKLDAVYLNLPMSSREAAILAGRLAEKGFLFAGVIPELQDGDVLKLQYLNNVLFDPSKVAVVSDTAQELLGFISTQYEHRP